MARRVRVCGGQPDVQGEEARLHAEAKEGQPEQRRQLRAPVQGAKVPAPGSRRESGKVGEEAEGRRVRGPKVKPACGPHLAPLPVQGDEEVAAHGQQLPGDQEMQPVGGQQHETGAHHQEAPPHAARPCGTGMGRVRPVFARKHGAGRTDDAKERQEQ